MKLSRKMKILRGGSTVNNESVERPVEPIRGSGTFEPEYLIKNEVDCVIRCPSCGNVSGIRVELLTHTLQCSNRLKRPNISNMREKCEEARMSLYSRQGGYRKIRKTNRKSKNRKTRRR